MQKLETWYFLQHSYERKSVVHWSDWWFHWSMVHQSYYWSHWSGCWLHWSVVYWLDFWIHWLEFRILQELVPLVRQCKYLPVTSLAIDNWSARMNASGGGLCRIDGANRLLICDGIRGTIRNRSAKYGMLASNSSIPCLLLLAMFGTRIRDSILLLL